MRKETFLLSSLPLPFTNTQQFLLMSKLRYGKFKNGEERCKRHKNVSVLFHLFGVDGRQTKNRDEDFASHLSVKLVSREKDEMMMMKTNMHGKEKMKKTTNM